MKENSFKALFSGAMAALTAYFHGLAIPIFILLVVIISDYLTGMAKSWILKELNSKTGLIGIVKKTFYLMVVLLGMIIDWLIGTGLGQVGIDYKAPFFFGILVTIWLIINESLSILENLSIIGVPLPSFLKKISMHIKLSVDKKGGDNKEE